MPKSAKKLSLIAASKCWPVCSNCAAMPVSARAAITGAIFMKLGRAPATHKTWVMAGPSVRGIGVVRRGVAVCRRVAFAHRVQDFAHDGQDAVDRTFHLFDALRQPGAIFVIQ